MNRALRRLVMMSPAAAIAACSLVNNLDTIGVGDGVPGISLSDGGQDERNDASSSDAALDVPMVADGGRADGDADACGTLGCSPLYAGLAAYWPFDNDYNDGSGNGLDLAVTSGTAQRVAAKFGNGYFGGLGSDYRCLSCGALTRATSPALDLGGDFTISLWVNRTANANVDVSWYHYALFDNGQIVFGANGNGPSPSPVYPTVTFVGTVATAATLSDATFDFRDAANVGVWVHLIVFRSANLIGLRVNGNETTGLIAAPVGSAAATFRVGHDTSGYPWQGVIDEVAVWKRALTGAEMDALYNGGAGRTLK